ncbi:hypothetical protein AUP68_04115 [Ilyonectria robusta]
MMRFRQGARMAKDAYGPDGCLSLVCLSFWSRKVSGLVRGLAQAIVGERVTVDADPLPSPAGRREWIYKRNTELIDYNMYSRDNHFRAFKTTENMFPALFFHFGVARKMRSDRRSLSPEESPMSLVALHFRPRRELDWRACMRRKSLRSGLERWWTVRVLMRTIGGLRWVMMGVRPGYGPMGSIGHLPSSMSSDEIEGANKYGIENNKPAHGDAGDSFD